MIIHADSLLLSLDYRLIMKNLFNYYEGSLSSFLTEAVAIKDHLVKIVISPVDSGLLSMLLPELDAEFIHVLDNYAIRHIMMKHANEKEVLRGQILVALDDFLLLAEILSSYDSVSVEIRQGRKILKYQKEYPTFICCYVEEIRAGRKELAAVTFYKKRKGKLTDANS